MGIATQIEWCDSTLNPMMGCDGCELWTPDGQVRTCYAGVQTQRYGGSSAGWPQEFTQPELFTERFQWLEKWPDLTGRERPEKPWLSGMPRTIFLCDEGDPFTESLPIDWLAPYLEYLSTLPHIFILLTKRPGRMALFSQLLPFPKNFWLLTSVTSAANQGRIAKLLDTRGGSLKGVSYEPLLGPVGPPPSGVGWIIVGGESGPGARPLDLNMATGLMVVAEARGIPFFFKQHGGAIKRLNGRELDGREYNGMPGVSPLFARGCGK